MTECWGVKTSGVCACPWMTYEDLAYWDWGTRGELVTSELYLLRRRLADSQYSLIQPDRLLSLHVPSSWHFGSTCTDEHAQVKRRPPRLCGAVASPRATWLCTRRLMQSDISWGVSEHKQNRVCGDTSSVITWYIKRQRGWNGRRMTNHVNHNLLEIAARWTDRLKTIQS